MNVHPPQNSCFFSYLYLKYHKLIYLRSGAMLKNAESTSQNGTGNEGNGSTIQTEIRDIYTHLK